MTEPGPIEGYALLSDLRTAALVDLDGSIDWLCLPRFDSPSCFARLLGTGEDGHWRIGPVEPARSVTRRYRGSSLVLETEFRTATGMVRLVDAMIPEASDDDDAPEVVRMLEGVEGTVEIEMRWVVRLSYGHAVPWVQRVDGGILAVAGPQSVLLRGDLLPAPVQGERIHRLRSTVHEGQRLTWTMQWVDPVGDELPAELDAAACVSAAEAFWREWAGRLDVRGPHADAVRRSLVTLKALSYAPTGAIVAAPTTSLPEVPGGERNWDYRYCWLRDATFTLLALDAFGLATKPGHGDSGSYGPSPATLPTCRSCTGSAASGTSSSGRPTGCPGTREPRPSASGTAPIASFSSTSSERSWTRSTWPASGASTAARMPGPCSGR